MAKILPCCVSLRCMVVVVVVVMVVVRLIVVLVMKKFISDTGSGCDDLYILPNYASPRNRV